MTPPSLDAWLREAQSQPQADRCGMYLFHTGVVRSTSRAQVRQGKKNTPAVTGMYFQCDQALLAQYVAEAEHLPGIFHVRTWVNQGTLNVGDPIMLVLIGGDTRPHVLTALETLVDNIKTKCVTEQEIAANKPTK